MKHHWILIAGMSVLAHEGNLRGETDEWVLAQRKIIAEARQSRSEESIVRLSGILAEMPMGLWCGDSVSRLQVIIPVIHEAAGVLRTIPGHADYHARLIREAAERYERAVNDRERAAAKEAFNTTATRTFDILYHVGSPETVRVLGDLVANRGGFAAEGDNAGWTSRLAMAALAWNWGLDGGSPGALPNEIQELGIDTVLQGWRLWYEQIQAGHRQLKFNDDPNFYRLDDPVIFKKED